jgi:hypothetical protein
VSEADKEIKMDKLGGGGLLVVGIGLAIIGWIISSGIVEFLLDVIGGATILAGVVLVVVGIVKMFSGNKSGASDF